MKMRLLKNRRKHVQATRLMVAELSVTLVNTERLLPEEVPPEDRKKFDESMDGMWKLIENAVKKYGLV